MRRPLAALLLGLIALAAGCDTRPDPTPGPTPEPAQAVGLEAHNAERAKKGLSALYVDARLVQAAAVQAADCVRQGRLNHKGSDGSWPWDRARRLGWPSQSIGENAFYASWPTSPGEAVEGWMHSSGHRANVLDQWTHMGMASAPDARGGRYWIAVYGR